MKTLVVIIRQSRRIVGTLRANYVLLVNVSKNGGKSHRVNLTRSTTWITLRRTWTTKVAQDGSGHMSIGLPDTATHGVLLASTNQWVRRWCASGHSLTSLSRNCATLLLELFRGLLHRRHHKVVIFMFWPNFLTFRFLLVRSALRVQQRPPSRLSPESRALPQQTHETVFIAWSWDEIRMSVSRLSWRTLKNKDQDTVFKTECVRVSKPDVCNWNEDCSVSMALDTCCHVTACMSSNTRGSADAHAGCHTLYKFVVHCKIQSTVWDIRTAEWKFQAPHAASDSWGESSPFTWSSHWRKPSSSEYIEQASELEISCALRHKRPSIKSTSLEWVEQPPRPATTMMMYVVTKLARVFCGALHHSIVA